MLHCKNKLLWLIVIKDDESALLNLLKENIIQNTKF